jgi:hypothetical protein
MTDKIGLSIAFDPPKLAGLSIGHFPCSLSKFPRADGRIFRNQIGPTSWFKIDRHRIRTGLRDDDVVSINNHSQAGFAHALRLGTKNGAVRKRRRSGIKV